MNRERLSKIGELALVAALVAGTGYLGSLVHHNYVVHGDGPDVREVRRAPGRIPARGAAGQSASVILEDRERPLLLLVLRTTCPFCEENMPGWVQMVAELDGLAADDRPEVMVLSVSDPDDTADYLERHGLDVPVRYVEGGTLPLLGLTGFPSTVAVEPATRSLSVWAGVLSDSDREAIHAWAAVPVGATVAVAGGAGR